jgi:hypothetical protein
LEKIGQCLVVSDHRAQVALEHFINPTEEEKWDGTEEEVKETEEKEKETKEENDPVVPDEREEGETYNVYATLNNSSDD